MQNFCRIFSIYVTCKASKIELHQSIATLTWWRGHQPRLSWVKMAVGLSEGPSYPGHSPHTNHFLPCSPLNDRRRVARSLFKIGLASLFSCFSHARLLILLLLLMSGNVHPNTCPVFPCSVCAGNVTWRGRSVQCCTCSNWVHLKCSLLSFSRFRTLGSSHSWSCPPCIFWRSHTYQHCDFLLGLLQLVYLHCSIWPIWPSSANAALAPHPRLQTFYPFSTHFVCSPSAPSPPSHSPGCWLFLFASCFLFPSLTPSSFFNGMLGVS